MNAKMEMRIMDITEADVVAEECSDCGQMLEPIEQIDIFGFTVCRACFDEYTDEYDADLETLGDVAPTPSANRASEFGG